MLHIRHVERNSRTSVKIVVAISQAFRCLMTNEVMLISRQTSRFRQFMSDAQKLTGCYILDFMRVVTNSIW
ncbi:hypothetical protein OA77_10905 [Pseudomonas coronafaciens]|nr:hypothetical protein OA77_10905 [Pseudomonas coronafaciens]